jgi:hypothetical protein
MVVTENNSRVSHMLSIKTFHVCQTILLIIQNYRLTQSWFYNNYTFLGFSAGSTLRIRRPPVQRGGVSGERK